MVVGHGTLESLPRMWQKNSWFRMSEGWDYMDTAKISLKYISSFGVFWARFRWACFPRLLHWGKLTVAQATVSCISLRFSCQKDYLDMLQMLGTRLALGGLEAWGNQDRTRNRFRDVMVLLCLYIYIYIYIYICLSLSLCACPIHEFKLFKHHLWVWFGAP